MFYISNSVSVIYARSLQLEGNYSKSKFFNHFLINDTNIQISNSYSNFIIRFDH